MRHPSARFRVVVRFLTVGRNHSSLRQCSEQVHQQALQKCPRSGACLEGQSFLVIDVSWAFMVWPSKIPDYLIFKRAKFCKARLRFRL